MPLMKNGRTWKSVPHVNHLRATELQQFVAGDMRVGLGEFFELRLVVDVRFRELERAGAIGDVCFDFGHTVNLLQVASDRGGTAPSRHVGHFEFHERKRRR